jgi:hypothetical protein
MDMAPRKSEDMVRRNNAVLFVFVTLLGALALMRMQSGAQTPAASGTLKVKLNYTGAGVVDERHKIYVLLFDANPFTSSSLIDATAQPTPSAARPGVSHILVRQSAAGKGATLTFEKLSAPEVYAIVFFDKNGSYNGQPDTMSGSPMGVYGELPDKLNAIRIEQGKAVRLVMTFDDSTKAP